MLTAALVLSAAWLLTALVLRVAIQVHRTGDTGLRLVDAPRWSAGWWAGAAFTSGTVLVVAGPALLAAGVGGEVDGPAVLEWAGLVLAAAGVVGTFAAQLDMGASWRIGVDPGERTALVTAGSFRWVRNPIFTAMIATALGLTLMAPTIVGGVGCVVAVVAGLFSIRSWKLRAARGRALVRVAKANGFSYSETAGPAVLRVPFELFRAGDGRGAENLLAGKAPDGAPVQVFDYFFYEEDEDLCWRLRRRGHRVGVCADAVVGHDGGGSVAGTGDWTSLALYRGQLRFVARRAGRPAALAYRSSVSIVVIAKAITGRRMSPAPSSLLRLLWFPSATATTEGA